MGVAESFRTPQRGFVLRWAWALLAANTVIILTGGAVRLTASGLGCPTWPRCTDDSFVPHSSLGIHGVIEFGNRMLTYVLIAVAIAAWIAVWRWAGTTRPLRRLATVLALGIPLQGVIGGITVLTNLNPWVVALHLLLSLGLVSGSVLLVVQVGGYGSSAVSPAATRIVWAIYAVTWLALYLGTVVTGSGPHAGDANAPRNGLDPQVMSHVHAASVYVLVALTVVLVVQLRGSGTPYRWALALLGVELAQGVIGFTQYWTGLPLLLVGVHLLGATVLVAVATRLLVSIRPPTSLRQSSRSPSDRIETVPPVE